MSQFLGYSVSVVILREFNYDRIHNMCSVVYIPV